MAASGATPDDQRNLARPAAAALLLACTAAIVRIILLDSFNGAWYPVVRALDFTADPPFRHRVLFVWLANLLRMAVPRLSPFQAYLASQVPAVMLALVFTWRLAARFVPPREAWVAPVLLTLILIPTITYRTFYDFGVVACFALASVLMLERRLLATVVVLAIATLNHEISFFLIVLFVLLYARPAPSWGWLDGPRCRSQSTWACAWRCRGYRRRCDAAPCWCRCWWPRCCWSGRSTSRAGSTATCRC